MHQHATDPTIHPAQPSSRSRPQIVDGIYILVGLMIGVGQFILTLIAAITAFYFAEMAKDEVVAVVYWLATLCLLPMAFIAMIRLAGNFEQPTRVDRPTAMTIRWIGIPLLGVAVACIFALIVSYLDTVHTLAESGYYTTFFLDPMSPTMAYIICLGVAVNLAFNIEGLIAYMRAPVYDLDSETAVK